jgi:hypothetical protein
VAVIYALLDDGKPVYVGQTTRHPVCRAWEHWSDAHYRKAPAKGYKGFRDNFELRAWLRELSEAPTVYVLEEVEDGIRFKAERYYINLLNEIPGITLLNFPPSDQTGYRHTDETRTKMSASRKGKILSEQHKANIAAGNRGIKRPKNMTPELREKLAENGRKGAAARWGKIDVESKKA